MSRILCVFTCISLWQVCFNSRIKFEIAANDNEIQCVNHLAQFLFKLEPHALYLANINWQIPIPIARFDDVNAITSFQFRRIDSYIINLKAINVKNLLANLEKQQSFNPRALFIVIVNVVTKELFEELAEYFINHVVVIDDHQTMYTYEPFIYENLNDINTTPEALGPCNRTDLFEEVSKRLKRKYPNVWRNTTLTVLFKKISPYVLCPKCRTSKGIEIELCEAIRSHLKFQVRYVESHKLEWGTKSNGTYNKGYGALQNREGAMVVGGYHVKFDEHLDFDMTSSYASDGLHWVTPKSVALPNWKRIRYIFEIKLWLLLLLSWVLILVFISKMERFGITRVFFLLYQILLESVNDLHKNYSLKTKILIMSWVLYCLIFSTLFKSEMVLIFASDINAHEINTIADVVRSKLFISIPSYTVIFYKDSNNPNEQYIYKHCEVCSNSYACMNRTAFVGDSVTITIKSLVESLIPVYYMYGDKLQVHVVKEAVLPIWMQMYFVKGHPLYPRFNRLIHYFLANGFVLKQVHLAQEAVVKARAMNKNKSLKSGDLGLKELQFAFIIWCGGIFFSIAVFCRELFMKFSKKKRRRRHLPNSEYIP